MATVRLRDPGLQPMTLETENVSRLLDKYNNDYTLAEVSHPDGRNEIYRRELGERSWKRDGLSLTETIEQAAKEIIETVGQIEKTNDPDEVKTLRDKLDADFEFYDYLTLHGG